MSEPVKKATFHAKSVDDGRGGIVPVLDTEMCEIERVLFDIEQEQC